MDEQNPHCPYCDSPMSYMKLSHGSGVIECMDASCAILRIFKPEKAQCIEAATDLKLLDRLLREQLEAVAMMVQQLPVGKLGAIDVANRIREMPMEYR